MSKSWRWIASAAAVVALAGIVAVTSQGAAAPRPQGVVPGDQAELLHAAEQILIGQCLDDRGFSYWPQPRNPVPELRDFPYVLDDVDWARRHGFGSELQRRFDEPQPGDPYSGYLRGLSPARRSAFLMALNGKPGGSGDLVAKLPNGMEVKRSDTSCVSLAEQRLYGDVRAWYQAKRVTDGLGGARVGLVTADPAYTVALHAWSACMRGRGFAYATPDDARAAVPDSTTPGAFAREVEIAVAEATCAVDSGMAATVASLDRHYAEVVTREQQSAVDTRARLATAALPRAREIVRAG
ncbi:hypothetical protein [Catellatospora methionotrophica]|uniref:hypothetical protein n=1 Tax=Catellatospora methionotrophica TaxID=121620 RepID=UPI00340FBBBE